MPKTGAYCYMDVAGAKPGEAPFRRYLAHFGSVELAERVVAAMTGRRELLPELPGGVLDASTMTDAQWTHADDEIEKTGDSIKAFMEDSWEQRRPRPDDFEMGSPERLLLTARKIAARIRVARELKGKAASKSSPEHFEPHAPERFYLIATDAAARLIADAKRTTTAPSVGSATSSGRTGSEASGAIGTPKSVTRSDQRPNATSAGISMYDDPVSALDRALGGIECELFNASGFRELSRDRERLRARRESVAQARMRDRMEKINARLGSREDRASIFADAFDTTAEELADLNDRRPSEAAESLAYYGGILDRLREHIERARAAVYAGGSLPLDQAFNPGSCRASAELLLDLETAHSAIAGLGLWLSMPSLLVEGHLGALDEVGPRFHQRRSRLAAARASIAVSSLVPETRWAGIPKAGPLDKAARRPAMSGAEVQKRLLEMRARCDPYTSVRDLAELIGCGITAVHVAIQSNQELTDWMAKGRRKPAPRAMPLDGAALENASAREADSIPEGLTDDEVEAILQQIVADAKEPDKARVRAMNPDARRRLAENYRAQQRDKEPSPLSPDDPGRPPRKVRQHPRV